MFRLFVNAHKRTGIARFAAHPALPIWRAQGDARLCLI
jgi:hypothetical protein